MKLKNKKFQPDPKSFRGHLGNNKYSPNKILLFIFLTAASKVDVDVRVVEGGEGGALEAVLPHHGDPQHPQHHGDQGARGHRHDEGGIDLYVLILHDSATINSAITRH